MPPETAASAVVSTPQQVAGEISPTDGELLMRFAKHDDPAAFAAVLDRHGAMVWGVCTRVLTHRQEAEDAYQATLLILARKASTIRTCDSVAGWLYRVAHNTALVARRRRKTRREEPLSTEPLAPPVPEAEFPDLNGKRIVGILLEELRGLPERYQTPLILRYLEGQSRRQIADATDCTVATIAGRLVRGKRLLRHRLARRGVSLAVAMGVIGIGSGYSSAHGIETVPANIAGSGSLPPFDPTILTSTASSAVTHLVHQGVRSMLFASLAKPIAVGATALVAAAMMFADPPAKAEPVARQAPLTLQSQVVGDVEEEASVDAPKLPAGEPIAQNKADLAAPVKQANEVAASTPPSRALKNHFVQGATISAEGGKIFIRTPDGKTVSASHIELGPNGSSMNVWNQSTQSSQPAVTDQLAAVTRQLEAQQQLMQQIQKQLAAMQNQAPATRGLKANEEYVRAPETDRWEIRERAAQLYVDPQPPVPLAVGAELSMADQNRLMQQELAKLQKRNQKLEAELKQRPRIDPKDSDFWQPGFQQPTVPLQPTLNSGPQPSNNQYPLLPPRQQNSGFAPIDWDRPQQQPQQPQPRQQYQEPYQQPSAQTTIQPGDQFSIEYQLRHGRENEVGGQDTLDVFVNKQGVMMLGPSIGDIKITGQTIQQAADTILAHLKRALEKDITRKPGDVAPYNLSLTMNKMKPDGTRERKFPNPFGSNDDGPPDATAATMLDIKVGDKKAEPDENR